MTKDGNRISLKIKILDNKQTFFRFFISHKNLTRYSLIVTLPRPWCAKCGVKLCSLLHKNVLYAF